MKCFLTSLLPHGDQTPAWVMTIRRLTLHGKPNVISWHINHLPLISIAKVSETPQGWQGHAALVDLSGFHTGGI